MGTSIHTYPLDLQRDWLGHENISEVLNVSRPDVIQEIHEAFFAVGCDAVETNTFNGTRVVLDEFGMGDKLDEINRLNIRIARQAAAEFATADRPRFVVGSVGPGTKMPSLTDPHRYATFDELHEYCYLVAATVGLLCIEIFGYRNPEARAYAIDLGVAFQLTNILRDVREDADRGRIYLPLEDLRWFEIDEDELLAGRYSPRLGALMAYECGRARAYYLRARGSLATEDRASLAPAEAMRGIYERLLARIEARHFDVFAGPVTLPRYERVGLALAAWGRSHLA